MSHFLCAFLDSYADQLVPVLTPFHNQVDDLNRQFTFPNNHFDLVHSRLVASGINLPRWPGYLRDISR